MDKKSIAKIYRSAGEQAINERSIALSTKKRGGKFARRDQWHVGRVRIKLATMIQDILRADGLNVRVDPSKLWPNQGYWRVDHRADCMPWEGQFEREFQGRWQGWTIGSWDTMTSLLCGFTYDIDGWSIELYADHPRQHPWMARTGNPAKV